MRPVTLVLFVRLSGSGRVPVPHAFTHTYWHICIYIYIYKLNTHTTQGLGAVLASRFGRDHQLVCLVMVSNERRARDECTPSTLFRDIVFNQSLNTYEWLETSHLPSPNGAVTEGWNPTNQTLFEFCPNGAWWPFRFSLLLESAVTPTKYIQPDMSPANEVRKREGKCPRGSYTRQCPSSLLHTTNGRVSPWIILRGRSKHITSTKLLYCKIDALSRSDSDISVIGILLCNCHPVIFAIANEN